VLATQRLGNIPNYLHHVRPGISVDLGGVCGRNVRRDLGGEAGRGTKLGTETGLTTELRAQLGAADLVVHLALELLELAVDLLVDLAGDEGAEAAVAAGGEPEDGVDKVDPDGVAHGAHARVLVPLVLVVLGDAQEDDGEGAEDGDPQDGKHEVPGEEASRPNKGLRNREQNASYGRQRGDDHGESPLQGLRPVVRPVRAHARAVDPRYDQGEDQLQTAADDAEPGLVDVDGFCDGTLAELGSECFKRHIGFDFVLVLVLVVFVDR